MFKFRNGDPNLCFLHIQINTIHWNIQKPTKIKIPGCLSIHGTDLTANNSTNNNVPVLFFVFSFVFVFII